MRVTTRMLLSELRRFVSDPQDEELSLLFESLDSPVRHHVLRNKDAIEKALGVSISDYRDGGAQTEVQVGGESVVVVKYPSTTA